MQIQCAKAAKAGGGYGALSTGKMRREALSVSNEITVMVSTCEEIFVKKLIGVTSLFQSFSEQ